MSIKAAAANPSLKFHAVLEAEFTQLHGQPPLDPEERFRAIWSAVFLELARHIGGTISTDPCRRDSRN
jgi:hypothetical protein